MLRLGCHRNFSPIFQLFLQNIKWFIKINSKTHRCFVDDDTMFENKQISHRFARDAKTTRRETRRHRLRFLQEKFLKCLEMDYSRPSLIMNRDDEPEKSINFPSIFLVCIDQDRDFFSSFPILSDLINSIKVQNSFSPIFFKLTMEKQSTGYDKTNHLSFTSKHEGKRFFHHFSSSQFLFERQKNFPWKWFDL
jgi:hypothetical protein